MSEASQEVYDAAALDQLFGKVPFLNGVLGDIPADQTARVRGQIASERARVDGLTDPRWRKAFNKWLDHAEYCCKKADQYREERPQRDAKWREMEQSRAEEKAAAADLMKANPPA